MVLPRTDMTDAYGTTARTLLSPLQSGLEALVQRTTEEFLEFAADSGKTAEVIQRLRPDEFKRLKQRQAQHIIMILSRDLTQSDHLVEARKAGKAHTLVGVEILWLIEAYNFYQDRIYTFFRQYVSDSASRELLMRIVSQRFLQDMEGQVSSYRNVSADATSAFSRIDHHVMSTANLTDVIRGALEIIGALPGDISGFFARVDDSGALQIEQSFGTAAERYHAAMEAGEVPRLTIDPTVIAGRGPGARAWRSGDIVVSDAWLIESDKAPWREAGEALGFRSSAAVPLLDDSGRSIALLSLYSEWPGLFSTDSVRGFLSHVQQMLSHAVQQRMSAPVVPLREQQAYRLMLNERQLVIHYQPIIDLHDGHLIKIEALARMRSSDGELISPQRFLPALGRDELLELFKQGLEQSCQDIRWLRSGGIATRVAINFPADGFDDERYEKVFFRALKIYDLTADHFQLEVLETEDGSETTPFRKGFIQRLRDAGVQIAQDDLGSGHSSLLRLDQYPFDEVKIDQGLVRGALHKPKRAVEFILYLTRLAHAFSIPVTVEGLENEGMIEAAAILGADRGQGYGIARPMPVDQLPEWHRAYAYTINAGKPKTAIGAMAGYLLWDMQLSAISERPELIAKFVGAKAIVSEFIDANNLQGSAIDQLLTRNHELAALRDGEKEAATIVRVQLIRELTNHWLTETDPPAPAAGTDTASEFTVPD